MKVPGGPAGLLEPGSTWTDNPPAFNLEDSDPMLDACLALWHLSYAVRRARGELGKSVVYVAFHAKVERSTVTGIEKGTSWPDALSLARVCGALNLRLGAVRIKGVQ